MTVALSVSPPILGVDEAWDKATPAQLAARGYKWVAGYLSPDKTGKNLTADNVRGYLDAGIAVLPLHEYAPRAPLRGYDQGVSDGALAGEMMRAMGWPEGRSCYFAIDFQTEPKQSPILSDYIMGCGVGADRFGYDADAYGDYDIIAELFARRQIRHGFQTYAWSGGQWVPGVAIKQTQNGILVGGHNVDKDVATVPDFGQWAPPGWIPGMSIGGTMQPDQAKQLADIDFTITEVPSFRNAGTRVPLHVWCGEINAVMSLLEHDHTDLADRAATAEQELADIKQAVTALTDVNGKALAALGQVSGSEAQLLGLWSRIADAAERLSPPPPVAAPASTLPPASAVLDTLP